MAIQLRYGAYADFQPNKMTTAEPAVVTSGDPSTANGKSTYVAYAAGDVERLLTDQDKAAFDAQISDIEDDLDDKVDKVQNKGLSTNDYTTAEKTKLAGIATGATNVVVDNTLTQSGAAADAKKTGDELADKVDKVQGKGLSTEDFTTAEKTKLAGIAAGATNVVVDNTLTQTGQAADSKKTGDEISDLKSDLNNCLNSLSAADFTFEVGKTITASGIETTAEGFALSSLLDVTYKQAFYNLTNGVGYNGKETRILLALYNGTSFVERITVSSHDKYDLTNVTGIRIIYGYPAAEGVTITTELLNEYFICAITDKVVLNANLSTDVAEELKEQDVLTNLNLEYSSNKKIPLRFDIIQYKLLSSSGTITNYSGASTYVVSDYIDISNIENVFVSCSADFGNGCCAFYDTNKTVISVPLKANSGSTATSFSNKKVTVPSSAKYMVLAAIMTSGRETTAYYVDGYKLYKWGDIKWAAVGDSLTEVNSRTTLHYHDYIAQETGINVVNMGVSGSGYKRKYDTNQAFYQRISNVPTDADVVTIFGSGNDQEYFSDMGTATDTGTTTLAGCINTTIDNLYAAIPAVQLGIIAPTPWADYNPANDNNGMARYTELLRQICKNRSIPFLDLYHESNLRPWDTSFLQYAYSNDNGNGVHPDETGHKLFAGRIREFLDSLIGVY